MLAPGGYGGLERVVQSLCLGLKRSEHAVHVAAVSPEPNTAASLLGPLETAGVVGHPVILPSRAYLHERQAIARLIEQLTPDVVHTHGYRPDVLAGSVARRAGIPTVTTMHGFTGLNWKLRLYERLQRGMLGGFDAVVAVSHPLADELARSGVPAERLHVIPNAWVELQVPLGRAAARRELHLAAGGAKVIGWVGRLSREKGADVLLEALARLGDPPVTLAVVGDGAERRALERQAERLGVSSRIRWCGAVRDAGRLFAGFDVFVLSSRSEGTPIALFEAMAAHTPIVATAVGGVPDVVTPRMALLVPPEDPTALANAVREVFHAPRHATARATCARTRLFTRFEPRRWVDAYETLYRGICRRASLAAVSS